MWLQAEKRLENEAGTTSLRTLLFAIQRNLAL